MEEGRESTGERCSADESTQRVTQEGERRKGYPYPNMNTRSPKGLTINQGGGGVEGGCTER
jgi:hypothetical protein